MAEQYRALSIRATLASDDYTRGAAAIAAANKEMSQSAAQAGTNIVQFESKVSSSADGLTKLINKYDPASKAARQFQQDLSNLNRQIESGKSVGDAAVTLYVGMASKLGLVASEAQIAEQGFASLASVVATGNERMAAHAATVDALANSYRQLAAEARAAQASDIAQNRFNSSFGIAQPFSNSASASAAVFEEQLRQQEETQRRLEEINRLRSQQAGQNFAAQTNQLLGVNGFGTDARASAAVFEEDARATEQLEAKINALRAAIDPVGASFARMNLEIANYQDLLRSSAITADEFAKAEALAKQRHEQFQASLAYNANDNAYDHNATFRRQILGYQAFDIGQGLASGLPLPMILAQQGPQIAQQYVGQGGGIKGLLSDVGAMAGGAAAAIGPIGLAFAAVAAAGTAFYLSVRKETKTTDEVLKEHAANIKALGDAYGIATDKARMYSEADKAIAEAAARQSQKDLDEKQKEAIESLSLTFGQYGGPGRGQIGFQMKGGYQEFFDAFKQFRKDGDIGKFAEDIQKIGQDKSLQTQADRILSAAKASKELNDELEKTNRILREISADKGPGGFLLSQGPTNQADMGNLAALQAQQAVAAARAEQVFRAQIAEIMARSPAEKANAARDAAAAQYNDTETPAARAQRIELAGTQALIAAQHELRVAKEDRARQSQADLDRAQFEITLIGKTVEEQNRLRAAYMETAQIKEAAARAGIKADQDELAAASAKAKAVADLEAKAQAGKMLTDQGYQVAQLQLEARLIGATADQRARATAALQAEIQLRQQGVNVGSQEAQQYIANAQAMATWRLQIDQMTQGWQTVQQAGMNAIDQLTASIGDVNADWKTMAMNMVNVIMEPLKELAIANPLKNAIYGTNLPTLQSIGGFQGFFGALSGQKAPVVPAPAGITNTGTMTVTAATVMINGSPIGGFPAAPGSLPGLGSLINPGAATTPTQTNAGGLPSLIGASTVANPLGANYVRPSLPTAANQNGVVPVSVLDAGRGFTTFQMSDGSIIRRDGTFAWRNNNPGNIESGQFAASQAGYLSGGGRFAAFDTFEHGTLARENLLFNSPAYANRTLSQAIYRYAPPSENNTESYISQLTRSAGVDRNTLMRDFTPDQRQAILDAQMRIEGNTAGRSTVLQPAQVDHLNQSIQRLSTTSASTAKNVTSLGDNSVDAGKSIMDAFGQNSALTKAVTPTVTQPQVVQPQITAPAASGFNPFSLFTGLFSLFGFADGTDYAPGGRALVGERGPEIVNLPRGSQVIPNHRLNSGNGAGRTVNVKHEYTINVQGNGDKELMDRMQAAAEETVRSGITNYDHNVLFKRIGEYQNDPYAVGA